MVAAYLDAAVDSAHTRRAYARHLRAAFTALGATTVAALAGADLARYRATVTDASLAPGSQAQALAALRSFLNWTRMLGVHVLSGDVVRTALKTPRAEVRRPYRILPDTDIAALLRVAATARDRALLAVLFGSGLRVAEVVGLDITDLYEDVDGGLVLGVRQGKGRRDRQVPVQQDVRQCVLDYLAATGRRLMDAGPLFQAHHRPTPAVPQARLSTRAVGHLVARCSHQAGLTATGVCPHAARHAYAVRILRAGGNVVTVQTLLGHRSLLATARYVQHLELAELRAAIPLLPTDGG